MTKLARPAIILLCLLVVGLSATQVQAQDDERKAKRELKKQVRLLLRAGNECYDRGSCDSSQVFLDSVLSLDPKNPDAFHGKAKAYVVVGDTASALGLLAEAVTIAPRSTRIKLLLARLHLMQDRPADAAALIDQVLAIKPNEGEALYLRGWSLVATGETTKAIGLLERAVAIGIEKNQR